MLRALASCLSHAPGKKGRRARPHEDGTGGSPLADGHDVQDVGEEDVRLGRVQDLLQPLVLHEVGHEQAQALVVGGLGGDQLEHGLRQGRGRADERGTVLSPTDSPSRRLPAPSSEGQGGLAGLLKVDIGGYNAEDTLVADYSENRRQPGAQNTGRGIHARGEPHTGARAGAEGGRQGPRGATGGAVGTRGSHFYMPRRMSGRKWAGSGI